MRWAGLEAGLGELRSAYKILIVMPAEKRPMGR
jgi:hypothetical protein